MDRIQIDFKGKVIRLEEQVNLKELFDKLNSLFPNNLWEEFDIDCKQIINWTSPIVIERTYPIQPLQPYYIGDSNITPYDPNIKRYNPNITPGTICCAHDSVLNLQFSKNK